MDVRLTETLEWNRTVGRHTVRVGCLATYPGESTVPIFALLFDERKYSCFRSDTHQFGLFAASIELLLMELREKSALLHQTLTSLGSLLVAYSGGTDSAFLAYAAHQALGNRMMAVIADSASLPRKELEAAVAFTAQHLIPTHIVQTGELDQPDYIRNDAQRCFHCKNELFHPDGVRAIAARVRASCLWNESRRSG